MRIVIVAVLVLIAAACSRGPVGNISVPPPAKSVDLLRYKGLWHEFARYENAFEDDCEGVTAEYTPRADGDLSVKNTCREATLNGPLKVSEGYARPAGDPRGGKLKVSFFGPALMTNYWVLDRADDYSWAIVGEKSGRFLWILTREARPSAQRRIELIARAKSLGYDTDMLRYTEQPAR
ncbi:MAG: lipocalin family protein [Pseudomonadota bacterium]|uniref:lipocalin family protein n=1 Tax=Phenylobacterium sp. TaxID=1871053 RepID=UPI0025E0B284|nr:lipocalin family protein [Phenylobacterium sp.]MBT9474054.1 lipocalin family protein [Phenylobacterium sp.]